MTVATELTDEEVQAIADEILGRDLGGFGIERTEARSGVDDDGDPALFLKLLIKPDIRSLPEPQVSDAHLAFHDRLRSLGDERFAYFRFRFTGEEIPGADPEPWR